MCISSGYIHKIKHTPLPILSSVVADVQSSLFPILICISSILISRSKIKK